MKSNHKVTLNVRGMTCATCVLRVEEGLKGLDGVHNASVNFATEKATVEYDPSIVGTDVMTEKVKDIGYEVVGTTQDIADSSRKTTISVGGMTCAACVRRVEAALKSAGGVEDASVNLATARATITHAPDWDGMEAIKRVIADTGYEFLGVAGETLEDPVEAARQREIKEIKLKFSVGVVLSIFIFMGSMQHWFPFFLSLIHI